MSLRLTTPRKGEPPAACKVSTDGAVESKSFAHKAERFKRRDSVSLRDSMNLTYVLQRRKTIPSLTEDSGSESSSLTSTTSTTTIGNIDSSVRSMASTESFSTSTSREARVNDLNDHVISPRARRDIFFEACTCDVDAVKRFIADGADVNEKYKHEWPLQVAIAANRLDIA
eukprot:CAMPEP_0177668946 /NCGR_PEP_ID=MMETSP0447-20121125/23104_1 /TAXON_ID=0 /ORGANISM="Stygamoeba regulata, Strain BSH-02190019" /LENGTH=170 /DNA_ID=CAMNT_0019175631 /DNA_START=127 /DNA_END=635 /DNA_ORIENTATION=+